MTAEEWQACSDVSRMVDFLRGKTTARKRILLGCGLCRVLHGQLLQQAEEVLAHLTIAELYADGEADDRMYAEATRYRTLNPWSAEEEMVRDWLRRPWATLTSSAGSEATPSLIREVFHPFAPPPGLQGWLRWEAGLIPRLAQGVYQDRLLPAGVLDPTPLAVLADAVEDAGYPDSNLLAHLRDPGPHVRGCWAVDAFLGKS